MWVWEQIREIGNTFSGIFVFFQNETLSIKVMEKLLFVTLYSILGLVVNDNEPVTFSNLDVDQVLKAGTQKERISELNYKKVCKCQCLDKTIYSRERKRFEFNFLELNCKQ